MPVPEGVITTSTMWEEPQAPEPVEEPLPGVEVEEDDL